MKTSMFGVSIPELDPTEEDRRAALKAALFNGGLGLIANSSRGNDAMLSGFLGGAADGYGQGMAGPMNRMQQQKALMDFESKYLGNKKTNAEIEKMQRETDQFNKRQDFFKTLQSPGQASMADGGGPSVANLNTAQRFQSDPSSMLSDPRVNVRALAAGVDPDLLGKALANTRPYEQKPGTYYNGQYLADPTKGIGIQNGQVVSLPGFAAATNTNEYASNMGRLAAELEATRARLPYDVQRAGAVAGAEASARDQFGFTTAPDRNGAPVMMTNPQARAQMGGGVGGANTPSQPGARAPNMYAGYSVSPQLQAARDSVRGDVLASEGLPRNLPTRLNDSVGNGGLQPQIGIIGQSPADQAQTTEIAKGFAKTYETLRDKASDAATIAGKYRQINQLLGDFEGGKLSPLMTDIASSANSLGFQIDKKLSNKEAARNIVSTMMGDFKAMLPGAMSDADRKFLQAIPPSEQTSSKGRARILAVQEKIAERAMEEHQMANRWIQKHGKLTPEFEQQLNYWRRNTNMFSTGPK